MIGRLHWEVQAATITIMSSREFNQDAGGAKKAADKGPVIITDRGRPAHVLLSFEDYVAQEQDDDIDFDPPRMGDQIFRPVALD